MREEKGEGEGGREDLWQKDTEREEEGERREKREINRFTRNGDPKSEEVAGVTRRRVRHRHSRPKAVRCSPRSTSPSLPPTFVTRLR